MTRLEWKNALKEQALPIAFAALGTSYYLVTLLRKPLGFADHMTQADLHALEVWQHHERDAKVALVFGVGAAIAMAWMRSGVREPA